MFKTTVLALAMTLSATTLASAAPAWTTGSVNFRDGPGTSYYRIGTIARCVQVEAGEQQGNWYRVQWNGNWGWVSASYLSWNAGYCGGGSSGYTPPAGRY